MNQYGKPKKPMSKIDVLSIDGKLLRTFLTVYDEQSVTRAADRLDCSQSAVSHSLEKLRGCIGDPLFVKSGRTIAATPVAASLAPKVLEILGFLEGLALQGHYTPEEDRATFTIAANLMEHMTTLTAIHKDLRARNAGLSLGYIELGSRINALPLLESGQADVVITVALGQHPMEVLVERLYHDEIVCYYDPAHRAAPRTGGDYCDARHAVVDFGGTTKSVIDAALDNTGSSRKINLRAANSSALADLARGTDALITQPKRLATTTFRDFAMCTPPITLPIVSYDLMCHRRVQSTPRHEWFMEPIRAAAHRVQQKIEVGAR